MKLDYVLNIYNNYSNLYRFLRSKCLSMTIKISVDVKIDTNISYAHISRFISLVCLFSLPESYFQKSLNKRERQRAKNWDEKRDGQREQLRSQLRLIIRVSAYQNAAARTPYVAIIARAIYRGQ